FVYLYKGERRVGSRQRVHMRGHGCLFSALGLGEQPGFNGQLAQRLALRPENGASGEFGDASLGIPWWTRRTAISSENLGLSVIIDLGDAAKKGVARLQ